METIDKPKFHIWLGDGWPGTYIVEAKDSRGKIVRRVAVMGATTMGDALEKAGAAFPILNDQDKCKEWSVFCAYTLDATDGTVSPPLHVGDVDVPASIGE